MQEPGQFTEEDSHYLLTASAYKPIQPLSSDHKVSFIPLGSESLDVHLLQTMHHGATVVHWDEDGSRSAICYLKLEAGNLTLTWCKPLWSSLRVSGAQVSYFWFSSVLSKLFPCLICRIIWAVIEPLSIALHKISFIHLPGFLFER